jgi:biotin carboxyl carrier protein
MALTNLAINDKILRFRLIPTAAGASVVVTEVTSDNEPARGECGPILERPVYRTMRALQTVGVDAVAFDPATDTVRFQVDGAMHQAHVMRQQKPEGVTWQVVFAHAPVMVTVRTNDAPGVNAHVASVPSTTVGQAVRFVPAKQVAAPVCTGMVLKSPLAGRVSRVVVQPGQRVERGQAILFIESMKMENEMGALRTAFIKTIFIAPGDVVQPEQILVEFEEEGGVSNATTKDVDESTPVQNR